MVTRTDGRHARRVAGRDAVIDTVFELVRDGRVPPPVDEVAARAGVSVATVFRYFDGLDDMHHQAFARFHSRYGPLLAPDEAGGTREQRVHRYVRTRLELCDAAGAVARLARLRAIEHPPRALAVADMRRARVAPTRASFAPELAVLTRARAAGLVATIDSLTSIDAWDLLRRTHERTPRQISQAWTHTLTLLLADARATARPSEVSPP